QKSRSKVPDAHRGQLLHACQRKVRRIVAQIAILEPGGDATCAQKRWCASPLPLIGDRSFARHATGALTGPHVTHPGCSSLSPLSPRGRDTGRCRRVSAVNTSESVTGCACILTRASPRIRTHASKAGVVARKSSDSTVNVIRPAVASGADRVDVAVDCADG